jgi:hypothetical protein
MRAYASSIHNTVMAYKAYNRLLQHLFKQKCQELAWIRTVLGKIIRKRIIASRLYGKRSDYGHTVALVWMHEIQQRCKKPSKKNLFLAQFEVDKLYCQPQTKGKTNKFATGSNALPLPRMKRTFKKAPHLVAERYTPLWKKFKTNTPASSSLSISASSSVSSHSIPYSSWMRQYQNRRNTDHSVTIRTIETIETSYSYHFR